MAASDSMKLHATAKIDGGSGTEARRMLRYEKHEACHCGDDRMGFAALGDLRCTSAADLSEGAAIYGGRDAE